MEHLFKASELNFFPIKDDYPKQFVTQARRRKNKQEKTFDQKFSIEAQVSEVAQVTE